MAPLTRVTGIVFGSTAPYGEIGQFGSAYNGTEFKTDDVATIQALPAYKNGWGSAVISNNNFPPMEEVTGVLKTISYQACYGLQSGVPIYEANTEYGIGDIVKVVNNTELGFKVSIRDSSILDNTPNIGKISDPTFWQDAIITSVPPIGVPQMTLDPTDENLPDNCVWLEGQYWLRNDYPRLFSLWGTTYNKLTDTDNTRFRFPDFRNVYICGLGTDSVGNTDTTMGYVKAGLPTLTVSQSSSHRHDYGTYDAEGTFNRVVINEDKTAGDSGVFGPTTSHSVSDSSGWGFQGDGDCRSYSLKFKLQGHMSGYSGYAGVHNHTISSSLIDANLNTVKVDGIKVRVYTRYQ